MVKKIITEKVNSDGSEVRLYSREGCKPIRHTIKPKIERTCTECNKKFINKNRLKLVCSDECYTIKQARLNTEYKKNYSNKYVAILKIRWLVFKRDNFICVYCGRTVKDKVKLQLEHKIPVSKGGKTSIENCLTSCNLCNLGKGTDIYEK